MARTITNGNMLREITDLVVKIKHSSTDTWYDLCNPQVLPDGMTSAFPGQSRFTGFSLSYSHDSGMWSGSISLNNHERLRAEDESLDPGVSSHYNPSDVPLLGAYHEIRIEAAKGGDKELIFQGFLGPAGIDTGEAWGEVDEITANLVGISSPHNQYFVTEEEGLVYKGNAISDDPALERDLLNQILKDYGFKEIVTIVDSPDYHLHYYHVGDTSLGEAIRKPVQSIGSLLMEKYDASDEGFRLAVVDPARWDIAPWEEGTTTPNLSIDHDLSGGVRATRLNYDESGIRTSVRIVYRDRTTGKAAHRDASSESARLKYGVPDGFGGRKHRIMRVAEADDSIIDTPAEAQKMAEIALWDVSAPCPEIEVSIPYLCLNIEGGDMVKAITASEEILVCVTEIGWDLTEPPGNWIGSTSLRGTVARRVGARNYWFEKSRTDWKGKMDRDHETQHGVTTDVPTRLDAQGVWGEGESGDAVPVLHTRWGGVRNWNTAGYRLRYREVEPVLSSTATDGSTVTVVDTGQAWTPKAYHDRYYVWLKGNDRNAVARKVLGNTATVLTIESAANPVIGAPTQTGSGPDDMETGGSYTGDATQDVDYRIEIDATGTPDTFKWSNDGGGTWEETGIEITGSAQTLEDGVQITFAATTGHTLSDYWDFTVDVAAVENGEEYELLKTTGDWTYVSTDLYPYKQIEGLGEGKRAIVEVAVAPVSVRR